MMKITDRRSIVVNMAEEQAMVTGVPMGEIATIFKDITIMPYGGVLDPNDPTLTSRGGAESYKIYDDLERDCHVYAVLQKRKKAITSREYQVIPATTKDARDAEAANFISDYLKTVAFDQVTEDLLDAVLKGFAVSELIWGKTENGVVPRAIKPKNQRRFLFNTSGELRMRTTEKFFEGVELPDRKFLIHRFGAKDGNLYGLGLGTRIFWPVWFKRQGITFWLQFIDKFAAPTVVAKYPPGTEKAEQEKLLAAAAAIRSEAGVAIPQGMLIEYLEAGRTGSIQCYTDLCRYMDEQISEAVLGETGTTNQSGSGGSNARDQVGNECRLEIAKADSDSVCETINTTLIRWVIEVNFPSAKPPGVWRVFDEPVDLKATADRDNILGQKIDFTKKYFMKTYSLEEDDFEVKATQAQGGQVGFAEAVKMQKRLERLFQRRGEDPTGQVYLDQVTGQLDEKTDPIMTAMIDQVRDLLKKSASLEEFRDKLLDLVGDMDPSRFARIMAEAFTVADLAGRNEVESGG